MSRVPAAAYAKGAVPVAGAYGVPAGSSLAGAGGSVAPAYGDYEPEKPECASVKKDGSRCKGAPIKDTPYCIGHRRYHEALQSLGE